MRFSQPSRADILDERHSKNAECILAAESGDVEAQVALAWAYARGDNVDLDLVHAWHWFDRAASSGQENAVLHRARFLQLRGVPEGIRELRKLAVKGNWNAQFWLATHYQSQSGRPNQLRAAVWYGRSYKNGFLGGKLAKLAQLRRTAHQPFKALFAVRLALELISFLPQLLRNEQRIQSYEVLLYRLKRRAP